MFLRGRRKLDGSEETLTDMQICENMREHMHIAMR